MGPIVAANPYAALMLRALAEFPRGAFDYVWILQPSPFDPALLRGLTPVWRDGSHLLLRVDDRAPPSPTSETG